MDTSQTLEWISRLLEQIRRCQLHGSEHFHSYFGDVLQDDFTERVIFWSDAGFSVSFERHRLLVWSLVDLVHSLPNLPILHTKTNNNRDPQGATTKSCCSFLEHGVRIIVICYGRLSLWTLQLAAHSSPFIRQHLNAKKACHEAWCQGRFHINGSSYTLMFATFWLEMEAQ